jgi:DNA invertase Pin-like site-specific DNA recombinase
MGLEVSRLARNCADWHRLLEICALSGTLILDEDGLYDPAHFNDRLLLGLKGTMSEAELHVLKARLRGGILSKAQRGELRIPLPAGLVYDPADRVVLDPDKQVQHTLRHFFETFRRTGAAWATVQAFGKEGLKFPRHGQAGSGQLIWQTLCHRVTLDTLHNPRYAGAFCFGKTRSWKGVLTALPFGCGCRNPRFLGRCKHSKTRSAEHCSNAQPPAFVRPMPDMR